MPLTPAQQDLVDAAVRALQPDPEIEALWLAGSLGRGGGDAWSDVDLLALAAEEVDPAALGRRYAGEAGRIASPVLANPLFGGRVVNVVTDDWRRFDISFISGADLSRYHAGHLAPLFNKAGRLPAAPAPPPYRTTPQALLPLINEFLRVAGLLVVADGRGEWVLSLSGLDIQRRLTVDLMLEENGIGPADRGGALHRNPFLTPQQRAELAALSPLGPDRASAHRGTIELAAIFLPRARRLAAEAGLAWPEPFEAATRRSLKDRLGLELPRSDG